MALTKEMHRLDYLSPKLKRPFEGRSIENICKNVEEMKSPKWCHNHDYRYHKYQRERNHRPHTCSLQSTLSPAVAAILASTQELDLDQFKKSSREP